jgi:uncharacterized membrane protein YhaH (DUF805 family)
MNLAKVLFSFKGRISRGTFIGVLALEAIYILAEPLYDAAQVGPLWWGEDTLILLLPSYVFLAIVVKRWHDHGKSGWWVLINLIPIVGWIWTMAEIGFLPGTPGPNAYGEDSRSKEVMANNPESVPPALTVTAQPSRSVGRVLSLLASSVIVLFGLSMCDDGGSWHPVTDPRTRTRIQFTQWLDAMEMYHQAYGHYPPIDRLSASFPSTGYIIPDRFAVALTGSHIDGTAVAPDATDDEKAGNTKLKQFYVIGDNEIDRTGSGRPMLKDAFGNTQIAIAIANADGVVTAAGLPNGKYPPVSPVDAPDRKLLPNLDPKAGILVNAVIYSAGKGNTDEDIVYSNQ